MLSNKWTFSLKILVVMLAVAFVGHTAMAAEFGVTLSVGAGVDASSADNIQVDTTIDPGDDLDAGQVVINVKFDQVVNTDTLTNVDAATADATNGTWFKRDDLQVIAYNEFGGIEAAPDITAGPAPVTVADGKNFTITLAAPATDVTRILVFLAKHKVEVADPRAFLTDGARNDDGRSAEASIAIYYVAGDGTDPTVYSIRRASDPLLPVTAATENVIILLSEQPKAFTKDHVDATNATWGDPVALVAIPEDADGLDNVTGSGIDATVAVDNMPSTGRDMKLYPYVLTITPKYENKNDIVVKVKVFEDMVLPTALKYPVPAREADYDEGMSKLTIKVGKEVLTAKAEGFKLALPEKKVIPGSGYLVVAEEKAGSSVHVPDGAIDAAPKSHERTPAELIYNVIDDGDLPNLETFLANGGVIDVMSPHALVISEVMWGSDASITDDHSKSQWIELYNAGDAYTTVAEDAATDAYEATYLVFYGPNETPPAMTAAVAATATTAAVPAALPAGVTDRIGTIDALGAYWSLAGKGQSGRTGAGEEAAALTAVVPTQPIISMYRMMDATGKVADGTMAASWMQSSPPNLNFDRNQAGNRVGSPGAGRLITAAAAAATAAAAKAKADAAAAAAAKAADTSVSMPKVGQIYISEVMFAGGGTLPQWIEISNGSRSEQVNLSDWTLTVENATADADVSVGAKAVFTIPEGTKIDPSGQNDTPSTILVVTEQGRNNVDGSGQILNLWTDQQTELILLGVTKRRYSLLSDMAFQITLAPSVPIVAPAAKTAAPTTAAGIAAARAAAAAKKAADATAAKVRADATDVVGNLGADGAATWALPMDEGARSSILRRHVQVSIGSAEPEDGMMMDSWALASDTSFAQVTHIRASSYYGSMDDVGTPGFRAGGALPVELSHFRPARNKDTGAVVITWSTQSELNNAGFYIKRSQQRDGEFQIINATMIAGAGTTSEKQFYTYEDTTAQPNVVYYYQIEDVSLDGNHQTLTRGIRLKGHVSVAGKLTTMWGDLKTQE